MHYWLKRRGRGSARNKNVIFTFLWIHKQFKRKNKLRFKIQGEGYTGPLKHQLSLLNCSALDGVVKRFGVNMNVSNTHANLFESDKQGEKSGKQSITQLSLSPAKNTCTDISYEYVLWIFVKDAVPSFNPFTISVLHEKKHSLSSQAKVIIKQWKQ